MNNEDRRREILREILENTTQDDMIILNYTEMFEAYKAAEVLINDRRTLVTLVVS